MWRGPHWTMCGLAQRRLAIPDDTLRQVFDTRILDDNEASCS